MRTVIVNKKFICYFWFVSRYHISFGFHLDLQSPNIEIHIPFGFIRIGYQGVNIITYENKKEELKYKKKIAKLTKEIDTNMYAKNKKTI